MTEQAIAPGDMQSTHAVDIFAFVDAQEIPFHYFETPYYLSPAPGGEKAYALLRETLRRTRKIGIAHVVIQMRRHLAALVPHGKALVLSTLRCASEGGRFEALCAAPQEIAEADLSERELDAAALLVDGMTRQWEALQAESGPAAAPLAEPLAEPTAAAALCDDAAEAIALEELLALSAQDSLSLGDEFMERLWGRPHRRPAQNASRRACAPQRMLVRHAALRGRPRRRLA